MPQSLSDKIRLVMGSESLTTDQVIQRLQARGWLNDLKPLSVRDLDFVRLFKWARRVSDRAVGGFKVRTLKDMVFVLSVEGFRDCLKSPDLPADLYEPDLPADLYEPLRKFRKLTQAERVHKVNKLCKYWSS